MENLDQTARKAPLTISVPEAGKRLGISRNAAYEAAGRGDLPVLRFGKRLVVPLVALDQMLSGAGDRAKAAA